MSTYSEFRTYFLDELKKRRNTNKMKEVSVEITKDAEMAILTASRNEVGDSIVAQIAKDGVRKTCTKLFGIKVSKWDADCIKFIG